MITYTLAPVERIAADRLARSWLAAREAAGVDRFDGGYMAKREQYLRNAAGGHVALAVYLGRPLTIQPRGGYLPTHIHASTSPQSSASLIIHDTRPDDHAYVLVIGTHADDTYRIVGWAWGHEREGGERFTRRRGGDGYRLGRDQLHPIESLTTEWTER